MVLLNDCLFFIRVGGERGDRWLADLLPNNLPLWYQWSLHYTPYLSLTPFRQLSSTWSKKCHYQSVNNAIDWINELYKYYFIMLEYQNKWKHIIELCPWYNILFEMADDKIEALYLAKIRDRFWVKIRKQKTKSVKIKTRNLMKTEGYC